MSLSNLLEVMGLDGSRYERVHGGDINEAYKIMREGKSYFLKINEARRYPQMFAREKEGLDALRQSFSLCVPKNISQGEWKDRQYLLLEWIDPGMTREQTLFHFGQALARMHAMPKNFFGWHTDNYIGSIQQVNTRVNGWQEFYSSCRILPLVKALYDRSAFGTRDLRLAENLCRKINELVPSEPPSLLHGDLWSGNFMINIKGEATIFDPAVYCGHREMDIAMTRLFGGFAAAFYEGYQQAYPLQPGWESRVPLFQLYPLLVHALLFGGHYVNTCREILKENGA